MGASCRRPHPLPLRGGPRPTPDDDATPPLAPGNYAFTLRHGGRERGYLVHVPPQVRAGQPLPLVLNFHGGGGCAAYPKSHTHMDGVADRAGFLAVYPNGTGPYRGRLLTFNAGRCCGYAQDHDVDDVGFTLTLLDDVARRTPLDRHRVYATGLSNGAMMAYRLALEASDRIAAIAPIAGGIMVDSVAPWQPVAVMHFHSADDPQALYDGGSGPPFPFTTRRAMHPPVAQVLARWVAWDGCPDTPLVRTALAGAPGTPDSGQTATEYVYAPCAQGAAVVHWKFTGVGHVWPGGDTGPLVELFVGRPTHLVDANVEMWRFFQRFSR